MRIAPPIATLILVTALAASERAGGQASSPPYPYKFTINHPPLMRDLKTLPLNLPSGSLEETLGTASWQTPGSRCGTFGQLQGIVKRTIVRKLSWTLTNSPQLSATDKTVKVTSVTGYTQADKVTFANTIGGSASAKFFGLGVGITDALKLTDETDRTWKSETTEETNVTYKANQWYDSWNLIDALYSTNIWTCGKTPPVVVNFQFQDIVATYGDTTPNSTINPENPHTSFQFPGAVLSQKIIINPLGSRGVEIH